MKIKHSALIIISLILALIILRPAHTETASPALTQLAAQVAALETTVSTQSSQIVSLQTAVTNLQTVQVDLQNRLQFVTVDGTEMYITGANLNIRNGLGATNGNLGDPGSVNPLDIVTNGLGNLVVGYNEDFVSASRIGSHNIIVGLSHAYSSIGGLVAGQFNSISGLYATVSGGIFNTASGPAATVSGYANTASGYGATVSGGAFNIASGPFASVSGGYAREQRYMYGWSGGYPYESH